MNTPVLQRHLLTVWNPSYAKAGVDDHLAVLLRHARDDSKSEPYVWWGKVRSPNRRLDQPMPHDDDIDEISLELQYDPAREVHLYITDYQSLYAGHIGAIEREDVRSSDAEHVPSYYAERDFECDYWFKLLDLQRIVSRDLERVISELGELYNVHYDSKSVSLYGGMHDLPLIVTRADDRQFFRAAERALYTDGRLWAELDADRVGGNATMESELRDNVLGATVWHALDHRARSFLAAGEDLFRAHRLDPGYDFSPVAVQFGKSLEVQGNAIVAAALAGVPIDERTIEIKREKIDPVQMGLSLGQLARALDTDLKRLLREQKLDGGEWLTTNFAKFVEELQKLRNPGAHRSAVDRHSILPLRDRLLGIGSEGIITRLSRIRAKGQRASP